MPDEKKQSGGVNFKDSNPKIDGDVVGRDKNMIFTLGTGAAVILVLGLIVGSAVLVFPQLRPTPQPTVTPFAFATAKPNELLLIVVDFDDRSQKKISVDPAQRIHTLINAKLSENKLAASLQQYHQPIKDADEARRVLDTYQATILIWGWYDELGAETRIELDSDKVNPEFSKVPELSLTTPEIVRVRFTKDIPAQASYVTLLSLGYIQLRTGNRENAVKLFTEAIKVAETASADAIVPFHAYELRGWSNYALQKTAEALADYTKALTLDPTKSSTYSNRGIIYRNMGDFERALADHTKAIEIDPQNKLSYNNRGSIYYLMGKYDQAIADCTKSIEIDPKYVIAYNNRARTYRALHKDDLAIADYSRSIELDSKNVTVYNNRGDIYRTLQKYDLALADYTKAIELNPQYAQAYCSLGITHTRLNNFSVAIASMEKGLQLDASLDYCKTALDNARKGIATP